MKRYRHDPNDPKGWKSYPLRLKISGKSHCCGRTKILVQSIDGGYVTADCSNCGQKATFTMGEFLTLGVWVSCPECQSRMTPEMVEKNYAYVCSDCKLFIFLADILPSWRDLF